MVMHLCHCGFRVLSAHVEQGSAASARVREGERCQEERCVAASKEGVIGAEEG